MFTDEKQFTTTASEYAIEEVYTNLDIPQNELYIPREGFTFRYPQRWLSDPSTNKVVGIRKLSITPTRHIITYMIEIGDEGKEDNYKYTGNLDVLPENQLLEMLFIMKQNIYDKCVEDYPNEEHRYNFFYDYEKGRLKFTLFDMKNLNTVIKFRIIDLNGELCKFLNQPVTPVYDEMQKFKTEHIFENVWDRGYIEFHASFSESKRQFIGVNNDFYMIPSLYFKAPNDGSVFSIRFTTDGKSYILPRYCRFLIQLCFKINYKRSIVK